MEPSGTERLQLRRQPKAKGVGSLSPSGLCSVAWDRYREGVRAHRDTIDLLDDALSRLLFWLPHSSGAAAGGEDNDNDNDNENDNDNRDGKPGESSLAPDLLDPCTGEAAWREVGYGLLSLHRLSVHLALGDGDDEDATHGASVRTRDPPPASVAALRTALTAVHSALPALVALAARKASGRGGNPRAASAGARLGAERAKFLLRACLLVSYWWQKAGEDRLAAEESGAAACSGVLVDGGMYRFDRGRDAQGLSWKASRDLARRRAYVGERTGRELAGAPGMGTGTGTSPIAAKIRLVAGELLYAARPLLWAWVEARRHPCGTGAGRKGSGARRRLWRGWVTCLAADLLSLRLLEGADPSPAAARKSTRAFARGTGKEPAALPLRYENPHTAAELKRRRLRLLLYLLRWPVWERATLPALEGASGAVLRRIPLLGGLAETVLWDWILYYQHPYVAEEG